jgi:hypothetical protein
MPRWPEKEGRYGEAYTGTKVKAGHSQGGPEATYLWYSGGQGVHREVESEGHEEKYRAVIDGGYPEDEPVGQGGKGRACTMEAKAFSFIPPYQGVCGRHGTEEQHVTSGGLAGSAGGTAGSEPISEERSGERCSASSRTAEWYLKRGQNRVTERSATGVESGKAAGEDSWEEVGSQRVKGGKEEQFHE